MDVGEITKILQNNSQKNFVKRILFPDKSPRLDLGNGDWATHKMAWEEADGKYYVFPTVMQEKSGQLKDYGRSAFDEALKRREFITVDSPQQAEELSSQYKKYWDTIGFKH